MKLWHQSLKDTLLDLVFPQQCLACGKEGKLFCAKCSGSLSYITPPVCTLCGHHTGDDGVCPMCLSGRVHLDGLRSVFNFEGGIAQAIYALKYHNLRSVAPLLGDFLADYLKQNPIPADIVVPVPLHPSRLKYRGYNQSLLLARELCRRTGLKLDEHWLERSLSSAPQARTKSRAERLENVKNAFIFKYPTTTAPRVIIIDDVATTGATLNACAATLKEAGALSVWGLTIARER
ncbi:MAG: ComF family protein [Dehalococcoides mccartyi]|uniref:ComF family protein n=1 Tax=Dehalococcoides TaxID=61434 RepID=UPI00273789B1|nr:ComF family protein [Dehalococcoides mccartyi]MDP4278937.1 ComF family protein [Dehalococcoides mccartyi]